jgi:hypothetical protein
MNGGRGRSITAPAPRLACSLVVISLVGAAGCGSQATLVRDGTDGGLVSYAYQTDAEVLASSGRRDAFRLIAKKCPKGSRIVREGEIPKVSAAADRAWRGQMGIDRLWGVQFVCE